MASVTGHCTSRLLVQPMIFYYNMEGKNMHAWESIQITVNYIEEHLSDKITIEGLAELANLSQFYYQRLFKRLVKKPVMEYIKLRRLATAADLLLKNSQRILDVALAVGFESHETFTRTFKQAYGMTPERFRLSREWFHHFQKPNLLLGYTMVDEDVPLVTEGIVLEVTRKRLEEPVTYLGITGEIPNTQVPIGETTGIDVPGQQWVRFHGWKREISELLTGESELGVTYQGTAKEGYFHYFTGGQAIPDLPFQKEFDTWELQPSEYVICRLEAESFEQLVTEALDKAYKYFFEVWLKNHSLEIVPLGIEKYFPSKRDSFYMEIWVIPS